MKHDALAFVASCVVSAVLGAFSLRCGSDDCSCPPLQARPDAQGPLSTRSIGFAGTTNTLGVEVQPGRVSVGVDELIIEYAQGGVAHRVRYEVLPAR